MDEILAGAAELGRKIAASEVFARLRRSESAVQSDEPTHKLLSDFEAQRRRIEELESSGKPVEVEDKHRMRDLADAVHTHPKLRELLRAQADYLEMMNHINRTIQQELSREEQPKPKS